MATLKDIVRETGLSINTVSRAVRGAKNVSPSAQLKVDEAVKKLNYRPNQIARDLRTQKSHVIIVIVDLVNYHLLMEKIWMIKEVAAASDYKVSVYFTSKQFTSSNFIELVKEGTAQNPAGMILIGDSPEVIAAAREISQIMPCALVAYDYVPGVDSVSIDRAQGVREAIYYLYDKGRRDIAFYTCIPELCNREKGYLGAIRELGLKENVVRYPFGTFEEIWQCGSEIAATLVKSNKMPDAIQTTDFFAAGLLAGFQNHGVRIPEDISIVGFDNLQLSQMVNPPLTTVCQPNIEVGKAVTELLLDRLNGSYSGEARVKVIPMSLLIRSSA